MVRLMLILTALGLASPVHAEPALGPWAGLMSCSDQISRLDMNVDGAGEVFIAFGGYDQGTESLIGSYLAQFTETNSDGILAAHITWIDQPAGYFPPRLFIESTTPDRIIGSMYPGSENCPFIMLRGDHNTVDLAAIQSELVPSDEQRTAELQVMVEVPVWLLTTSWRSVSPCDQMPASVTFSGSGTKSTGFVGDGVSWVALEARGQDIVFGTGSGQAIFGLIQQDRILMRTDGWSCVSVYAPEGEFVPPLPADPFAATLGTTGLSVGGLMLGQSREEAFLALVELASGMRAQGWETSINLPQIYQGHWTTQSQDLTEMYLTLMDSEKEVTVVVSALARRESGFNIFGIQISGDGRDRVAEVTALIGPPAQEGIPERRFWWVDGADEAVVMEDPGCTEFGKLYESFDDLAAPRTNCGLLTMAAGDILRMFDSAVMGGTPAVARAPAPSSSESPLPLPGPDLTAQLNQGTLFRFSFESRLFVAGYAGQILDACQVGMEIDDQIEIATFVQSMGFVAGGGRRMSDEDLASAMGGQLEAGTAAMAGAASARQQGCSSATRALENVLELIRANNRAVSGGSFGTSCQQRLSEPQCTCLAQTMAAIDPGIANRSYSSEYVYGLLQANPFLGIKLWSECRINEY